MTMERRRFGAGLAAGLLVGLGVVVTLSAFSFGLFGTFSSTASYPTAGLATYTAATSTTETTAQPGPQPAKAANGTLSALTNLNSSAAMQTGTSYVPLAPATGASFSSRVDSIARQPILTDAVVFLPVLVALLLGALLYVASTRGRPAAPPKD